MPGQVKTFKVFVSSPGDVGAENAAVLRQVDTLNRMQHIRSRCLLQTMAYKKDVPPLIGVKPQQAVDAYMDVSEADIFVCVLWQRMGTPLTAPDGRSYKSGTEYEFSRAYAANADSGIPKILLYRCTRDATDADPDVQSFFAQFEGPDAPLNGLYKAYASVKEFEDALFIDLDNVLSELLRAESQGESGTAASISHSFYRHITLPREYVARPMTTARIVERVVMADEHPRGALVAMHGLPGSGKSVVARALCDEPEIHARFPDGVLWTTLGKSGNIESSLVDWLGALDIATPANTSRDSLKNVLAEALTEKACLLIVDDVWAKRDLEAFLVGGPRCCVLITTRIAAIATAAGALVVTVPPMDETEAVELLVARAAGKLDHADSAVLRDIVDRLSRLPLALKIAGAQLAWQDPQDWLEHYDIRELQEDYVESAQDNLLWAIGESVKELTEEARSLFHALSIFAEDDNLPEAVVTRLWQAVGDLNPSQVRRMGHDLSTRGLVDFTDSEAGYTLRLHDVIRDASRAEITDEAYCDLQRLFLGTYGTTDGNDWLSIPNDGYIIGRLSYHLEQAEDLATLQELFEDDGWLHASIKALGYTTDSYVRDIKTAWALTQRMLGPVDALPKLFHYALIRSSINSVASNYTTGMVARALRDHLWDAQRLFSTAARTLDSSAQFELYMLLLNSEGVDDSDKRLAVSRAYQAAAHISWQPDRANAIGRLAPSLDESQLESAFADAFEFDDIVDAYSAWGALLKNMSAQAVERTLSLAKTHGKPWQQAALLCMVIPSQVEETRQELVDQLRGASALIHDSYQRGVVLGLMASLPEGTERANWFEESVSTFDSIEPQQIVTVIRAWSECLDKDQLERLLKRIETLPGAYPDIALAVLLPVLPKERRESLLQARLLESGNGDFGRANRYSYFRSELNGHFREHAVNDVLQMQDENAISIGIGALAGEGTTETEANALYAAAQRIRRDDLYCIAMSHLLPYLQGDQKQRAIDVTLGLSSAVLFTSSSVFDSAIPYVDDDRFTQILQAAGDIDDWYQRAEALQQFAQMTSGDLARQLLDASLQMRLDIPIKTDNDEMGVAVSFDDIAGSLDQNQIERALNKARDIQNDQNVAFLLAALGPFVQAATAPTFFAIVSTIRHSWSYVRSLAALAECPDTSIRAQARADVEGLGNEPERTWGLLAFQDADGPGTDELVDRALSYAEQADSWWRGRLLKQCARLMAPKYVAGAVQLLDMGDGSLDRAEVLKALAPHLDSDAITAEVEALAGLTEASDIDARVEILLPYLKNEDVRKIAKITLAMQADDFWRFSVLQRLAPLLSEGELDQALAQIDASDFVKYINQVCELIPHISQPRRNELVDRIVTTALGVKDELAAIACANVLPLVDDARRRLLIDHALETAGEKTPPDSLVRLIGDPPVTGDFEIAAKVLNILSNRTRKQFLGNALGLYAKFDFAYETIATMAASIQTVTREWEWF